MTHGYTAFALDVLRARYAAVPADNLFFSPFSLSAALSMTAAGARGETLAQMQRALRLEDGEEKHEAYAELARTLLDAARDDVELRIANGLFAQQDFEIRAELLALTRDKYDAALELADFKQRFDEERERINEWVAARTKRRIMNLIPRGAISDVTRLVLVNAIYFLGKWRTPFEQKRTQRLPFFGADGARDVETMQHLFQGAAEHGEDDAAQWLRLRYGQERGTDDVAMVVGLPNDRGALAALIASLHPDRVRSVRSSFSSADVSVRLPRFRVEGGFSANQMLRDLGMVLAFDCTPGSEADLSGIAGAPGELCISEVIHKAFVEVDEQGTEAAAATAVMVAGITSVGPRPKTFFADHPFVFWIEHVPSGTLLFLGAIRSP